MNIGLIKSILNKYNVEYVSILPPQSGYRNQIWPVVTKEGHTINLTIFKTDRDIINRIKNASQVSDWLFSKNMPTRKQLDPRLVSINWNSTKKVAGLYTYLPGYTIAWESYTKNHLKLIGLTMADMHKNLSNYNHKLPSVYDELVAIANNMSLYFSKYDIQSAMTRKLYLCIDVSYIKILLNKTLMSKNLPHQQVLHLDFVRGNILYNDKNINQNYKYKINNLSISGILDFEKVSYGYVGIDIARTLAFLYIDCKYKKPSDVYKYFLVSGYYKHGNNEIKSIKFLTNTVLYFLLYDFYKFLRHNPYQDLHLNEHYIRTRAILVQFGIIKYKEQKGIKRINE